MNNTTVVLLHTPANKCALKHCDRDRSPGLIGCDLHPVISPSQSCDNLPALDDDRRFASMTMKVPEARS